MLWQISQLKPLKAYIIESDAVYTIGLTGYIASGKSLVSTLFSKYDIQIINADYIAKELTSPEQTAFKEIVHHFGSQVLTPNQTLNRAYLRQVIFSQPLERQWLEDLLHPLIQAKIKNKVDESTSPYCIIEIPLLVDRTNYPYLNRVLTILAPYELRLKRLTMRDNCTEKDALLIVAAQADDAAYRQAADDIIINDGSIDALEIKILHLHHAYMQQARKKKS